MEYTRENVIKSLRACADGDCESCLYFTYKEIDNNCDEALQLAAAAMLEEIGKGELPRRSVAEKREPTMDELWIEHETLRGRANVFGGHLDVDAIPPYDNSPDSEKEMKEEIAYFEGFCDAAIVVIEAEKGR